jgi:hypothetical protein
MYVHTSDLWVLVSVLLDAPTCTVRVDEVDEFHLPGRTVQWQEAVLATLPHTSLAGCVLNEPVISVPLTHIFEELRTPVKGNSGLDLLPSYVFTPIISWL